MTAYIDNNVLISIENGDYSIDKIKSLFSDPKTRFFYSSAHVFEAEAFPGTSIQTKSAFLNNRFQTIREIFKKNYLFVDPKGNKITHIIEDPKEVYDTITLVPTGIDAMKNFMNLFSKEQKEEVRKSLGIETHRLNNYSPSEAIEHLNSKLTIWQTNLSFLEMIEQGVKNHPDGKTFGLHNRIAGVFELLDMLGYWKDKETGTSNYARLWDSSHTHFASYCDYFVSDDKRTRYKASVAYGIYNKSTKIISAEGEK